MSNYSINFASLANQEPWSDPNWTPSAGTLQILNGFLQPFQTYGSGTSVLTGPTLQNNGFAQYIIGTFDNPDNGNPQITLFARTTSNNAITNGQFRFLIRPSGAWLLQEVISGSLTAVGSGTLPTIPAFGDTYTLIFNGDLITAYQNGHLVVSYTDLTGGNSQTNVALLVNANGLSALQNVAQISSFSAGTGNPLYYSVPDCRDYATFPNLPVAVNGTNQYTAPSVDSRAGGAPVDSRAGGAPVACGVYPQNSRTPGTFGPDE